MVGENSLGQYPGGRRYWKKGVKKARCFSGGMLLLFGAFFFPLLWGFGGQRGLVSFCGKGGVALGDDLAILDNGEANATRWAGLMPREAQCPAIVTGAALGTSTFQHTLSIAQTD